MRVRCVIKVGEEPAARKHLGRGRRRRVVYRIHERLTAVVARLSPYEHYV